MTEDRCYALAVVDSRLDALRNAESLADELEALRYLRNALDRLEVVMRHEAFTGIAP